MSTAERVAANFMRARRMVAVDESTVEDLIRYEVEKKLGARVQRVDVQDLDENGASGEVRLKLGKADMFASFKVQFGRSGFHDFEVELPRIVVDPNGIHRVSAESKGRDVSAASDPVDSVYQQVSKAVNEAQSAQERLSTALIHSMQARSYADDVDDATDREKGRLDVVVKKIKTVIRLSDAVVDLVKRARQDWL